MAKKVKADEKKNKKSTNKSTKKVKEVKEVKTAAEEELDVIIEELEKEKVIKEKKVLEDDDDILLDDEEEDDEDDDDDDEVVVEETTKSEKKVEKKEKVFVLEEEVKLLKIISIVLCVISAISLILNAVIIGKVNQLLPEEEKEITEDTTSDYDVSMFKEISASKFIDMFDEDDDELYFVYTGRSDCGYCVKMLPNLQQSVKEYDYTLYYVDINKVSTSEATEIKELDEKLEENFTYTPMVFAVKNGKVIDVNNGYTEYSVYSRFLQEHDVDKK